ncbi:MAG TPA: hypothetical protein VFJ17_15185 [Mycobacteriales bacterium]|jgi:hypothetical protein|nr:hypothetical protein [Mycobacteriales bacterium]
MFKIDRVSTRLIGGVAIGTMIVGSAMGAEAATKKKKPKPIIRTEKIPYQGGCGIDLAVAQATPGSCVLGASYDLSLKKGEKYISISVADDVSPDVPGILWLGTGLNAPNQAFCSTIKNFPAAGTAPSLDLFDGPDASCAGSAFTGTVTVTFSSNPLK